MSKAPHFNLSTYLPYRLSVMSNRISQGIAEIYQEKYKLSITEWRIMAILGSYKNITASEIVQHTAMDKVAISRGVKKLIERGIIDRSEDIDDRRRLNLRLSEPGQKVYDEVIPKAMDFESMYIEKLNAKDLSDLERIINKLLPVLKQ